MPRATVRNVAALEGVMTSPFWSLQSLKLISERRMEAEIKGATIRNIVQAARNVEILINENEIKFDLFLVSSIY